jgi:hypothetical protein
MFLRYYVNLVIMPLKNAQPSPNPNRPKGKRAIAAIAQKHTPESLAALVKSIHGTNKIPWSTSVRSAAWVRVSH